MPRMTLAPTLEFELGQPQIDQGQNTHLHLHPMANRGRFTNQGEE